tara:strand:- start:17 stop:355 length:339 start_codon:yes stop_codon:yes gene_type:complete
MKMTYEISDTVSHHNEDMFGADTCGKCAGETDTHDAPCPEATDQFIVELDDACPHAADETDANGYETEVTHDGRNCYAVIELDSAGEFLGKDQCCLSEEDAQDIAADQMDNR